MLHRMNIYGDLRSLLMCDNANVRAKAHCVRLRSKALSHARMRWVLIKKH